MCGIVGFVSKKPIENAFGMLESMTDAIRHRGPDDSGIFFDSSLAINVGLGHRRLSIIDLSNHSHQPMVFGDISVVFNGEIYNYIELRDELKKYGHIFESSGDTEVVIKAYIQWGCECFSRFNGMWGVAIYDKKNQKLVLSRDRFGKKPLYYYKTDNEIVFASEIKSILLYPNIPRRPNFEKIFRYLSNNYRYVDIDDTSFFGDIYSVPKSSFMIISNDLSVEFEKYWELSENRIDLNCKKESSIVDDFRNIFIDSVKIRLRSDVSVGCMLSGGVDSTSVTSVAYKVLGVPVFTFSGITGEEKGIYDESEYIEEVVRDTGAEHVYIKPEPSDLFETVNEMLLYHDEPICTVTWYVLYQIAKKIKEQKVPVVLNGYGGDEMIGGYWDHYHYNFFDIEVSGDLELLDYEQKMWLKNYDRRIGEICQTREYIKKLSADEVLETSKFYDYSECFTTSFIHAQRRAIRIDSSFSTMLSKKLQKDLLYECIPATVKPEDRNTMANSIESRSPMLDYRLAEFCFSLPNNYKIRDGVGKWILREAMKGILPEKVRTRRDKAGLIAPADRWFRDTNREEIKELINSEFVQELGIFNISRINSIFDEHVVGLKNHQMFLWQLINLILWYKKFFITENGRPYVYNS